MVSSATGKVSVMMSKQKLLSASLLEPAQGIDDILRSPLSWGLPLVRRAILERQGDFGRDGEILG
jgi:hypothetical protein